MKRKIEYLITYSNGCQIKAKLSANNCAEIFVNDVSRTQVAQDNLDNNIDGYVNQYAHEVCHIENTNEWSTEETFYRIENAEVTGVPYGTVISHVHTRGGGVGYSLSIGNRKIMHDGLIPSMDYIQVLFEEWRQRYQHINNN